MTAHTRKHANPCPQAGQKSVTSEQKTACCFLSENWLASSYKTDHYGLKNLKCCVNVAVLRVNISQTARIH